MELRALDESRLSAVAEALGAHLRPGDVMLLEGPMGAGKTTWTRALARGLRVARPDRVRSPTYTLCMVHDGPCPLVHVDLFRLAPDDEGTVGSVSAAAFEALGLEALADGVELGQAVLVVEWAELWAEPPKAALRIQLGLDARQSTRRHLVVEPVGARPRAVVDAWAGEIDPR